MLDNLVTRKLAMSDNRTRYQNPHITAADLIKDKEEISPFHVSQKLTHLWLFLGRCAIMKLGTSVIWNGGRNDCFNYR